MNAEQITGGDVVAFTYQGRPYAGTVAYVAIYGDKTLIALRGGQGAVSLPLDFKVTVVSDGLTGEDY